MTSQQSCRGHFIWRKQPHDTKITDISLSINGFIVFSFLTEPKDTFVISINNAIYERFED